MQEIFSQEEMAERLLFTQFLNHHFVPRKNKTEDFRHPLDTGLLYRIYRRSFPDGELSEADIHLYCTITGLLNPVGAIFVDLRATKVEQIPPSLWRSVEPLLRPQTINNLTSSAPASRSIDPAVNTALDFFDLFVRRRSKNVKVSISRMFNLYSMYAMGQTTKILGRKRFVDVIKNYLGDVKKGYADGKSGATYTYGEIPDEDFWPIGLSLGLGIFEIGGKFFDNEGKVLFFDEEYKPDTLTQAHILYRITGGKASYESGTKEEGSAEQEEETYTNDFRREEESAFTDAEEDQREDSNGPIEGSFSGTEECRHEDTEGAFIDFTKEFTRSEPAEEYTRSDISEYAGTDDEFEGDYQEEPTLKEIFAALEVAYKITPGAFDQKMMNSYLVSMDVDYAAADIWDDFMEYLRG